jgi:hypothetical protein
MNDAKPRRESLVLRVLWMLLFLFVWQAAELLLALLVVAQLVFRLINGAPSGTLMDFGDSLSQYLAQIGRFGAFHTDAKPWPFADWPVARVADGEAPLRAAEPLKGDEAQP